MKNIDVAGLIKLVVGVLTPAAIFYAVGYIVIQAYVTRTGLQASFWFTEGFYREAGARFLLHIVLAVALLPHLFIPLSALFIVLFPGDMRGLWHSRYPVLEHRFGFAKDVVLREAAFLVVIIVALSALGMVLKDCGNNGCATTLEAPEWLFTSSWLFEEAQQKWLSQQPFLYPMAIFLALAIPTVTTLGLWGYGVLWTRQDTGHERETPLKGASRGANHKPPGPLIAFLILSTFVVLTTYIPIAYGTYFYDFVVVKLADTDKCAIGPESTAVTRVGNGDLLLDSQRSLLLDCYLLGRFETRYILIGREASRNLASEMTGEESDQRIYIKQVDKLEPFAIESTRGSPLRSLTPLEIDK